MLLCNFSHTAQPDRRGAPALRPGLGRLRGVPLGRPPSLQHLRQWLGPVVVRWFLWYYGAVRLPVSVHVGRVVISLLRPPHRTNSGGRRRDLPVPVQGVSTHTQGLRLRGTRL